MPRTLNVARDLMRAHARWAERSRALLARHHVAMINLIGAPGSGKTRLLERTVRLLRGTVRWAVLEGDVETTRDADRLARLGCRVNALITEGGCHTGRCACCRWRAWTW